jgi:hypothetical protein
LAELDKWQSNRVNWLSLMVVAYLLYGLPIGALVGGVVGTAIWGIHASWRVELGPVSRFAIGTLLAMVFWSILLVLSSTNGFAPQSWHSIALGVFEFGGALGGLAGLVSGRQTTTEPTRQADHSTVTDFARFLG